MPDNTEQPTRQVVAIRPRREAGFKVILLILLSIASGFLGGWMSVKQLERNSGRIQQGNQQIVNEDEVISDIAKTVGPSVVSVNVTSQGVANDFFGFRRNVERQSAGTGVIISDDGLVITNRHVVPRGVSAVTVTLSDGTELNSVEVLGRTSDTDSLDIAFLKIKDTKGKKLLVAKIGDSSQVRVGQKVIAIGNALGLFQNTVTAGIISGFGRTIEAGDASGSEVLQNLFQTDAAINEGNSGGPLVNSKGEVIAINTAVAGRAENVGFAIPINDVQGLIRSVRETGKLLRPYLGVSYIALTDDIAYEYNLPVKRGAYLAPRQSGSPILEGSPAAKAGLKEKDIISKVNGKPVDESNSLISLLGRFSVGDEVTLTILRDAKEQDIKVKLEPVPGE